MSNCSSTRTPPTCYHSPPPSVINLDSRESNRDRKDTVHSVIPPFILSTINPTQVASETIAIKGSNGEWIPIKLYVRQEESDSATLSTEELPPQQESSADCEKNYNIEDLQNRLLREFERYRDKHMKNPSGPVLDSRGWDLPICTVEPVHIEGPMSNPCLANFEITLRAIWIRDKILPHSNNRRSRKSRGRRRRQEVH